MTALRTAGEIIAAGLAPEARRGELDAVAARYAVAIPDAMLRLIDPTDPDDPIAKQFIPYGRELVTTPEERADPIGDLWHSPVEGIVHRYPDRVLLKAVHVCPVYCRFCFRREMVGPQGLGTLSAEALDAAIGYIAAHSEIWEVLLTGGDPLILSPRRLGEMMARLADIPHVKVVRFHTRVPVVEPERIDAGLIAALKASGKTTYLAVHANHPRELTAEARAACARMVDAGVALISQTVLLKGVNDDQEAGINIVRRALQALVRQIATNAGDEASIIVGKILDKNEENYGYNAQTGEYGDMVAMGIIDPTKVARSALQNAASVAGLLLTTEAMIAEAPRKDSPPPMPGGGMGMDM